MRTRSSAVVLAAIVGATAVAACNGGGNSPASTSVNTSTPTTVTSNAMTPTTEAKFGTVVKFRDALIAVGFSCPSWEQANVVKYAAESGTCSDNDVLATYVDDIQRAEAIAAIKASNEAMVSNNLPALRVLFGANWSLNAPVAVIASVQPKIGGVVVQ